jgi:hypothetical protein
MTEHSPVAQAEHVAPAPEGMYPASHVQFSAKWLKAGESELGGLPDMYRILGAEKSLSLSRMYYDVWQT